MFIKVIKWGIKGHRQLDCEIFVARSDLIVDNDEVVINQSIK